MFENLLVTINNGQPLRISVANGDVAGSSGISSPLWLTDTTLDVLGNYRYVTGFRPDGSWQVNRRDRASKALTIAKASNNGGYTYTTQSQLRSDLTSLTYS